jgi:hypothetical protein
MSVHEPSWELEFETEQGVLFRAYLACDLFHFGLYHKDGQGGSSVIPLAATLLGALDSRIGFHDDRGWLLFSDLLDENECWLTPAEVSLVLSYCRTQEGIARSASRRPRFRPSSLAECVSCG